MATSSFKRITWTAPMETHSSQAAQLDREVIPEIIST